MTLEKLNKALRIIVAIGLLIILLEALFFEFGDCDKCKFKVGNKVFNAVDFMKNYSDSCFKYESLDSLDLPKLPKTMPLV